MCNGVWLCSGCDEIIHGDFTEHAMECVKNKDKQKEQGEE